MMLTSLAALGAATARSGILSIFLSPCYSSSSQTERKKPTVETETLELEHREIESSKRKKRGHTQSGEGKIDRKHMTDTHSDESALMVPRRQVRNNSHTLPHLDEESPYTEADAAREHSKHSTSSAVGGGITESPHVTVDQGFISHELPQAGVDGGYARDTRELSDYEKKEVELDGAPEAPPPHAEERTQDDYLGVYSDVMSQSPVRRAEEQRRRLLATATSASTGLRYRTNPLHLVVQQKIIASIGHYDAQLPPHEGSAEDADATSTQHHQPASGAHASSVTQQRHQQGNLIPSRPTTAPHHNLHQPRKVSPTSPIPRSDYTRPSTALLASVSSKSVRTTSGGVVSLCDQSSQTAAGSNASSIRDLAPRSHPLSIHSTAPARTSPTSQQQQHPLASGTSGGADEEYSVEDMLSTPKAKRYLEQLLSRPTPFADFTVATLDAPLVGRHHHHHQHERHQHAQHQSPDFEHAEESDSSRDWEPNQPEVTVIPVDGTGAGSSSSSSSSNPDEVEDVSLEEMDNDGTHSESFTPTSSHARGVAGNGFPLPVITSGSATSPVGKRPLVVPVPRSPRNVVTPGSDNGSLLELVPTMSRPQAEFASVISRTMSMVNRVHKQAAFPMDINGGVAFVDPPAAANNPIDVGQTSGTNSGKVTPTSGSMSQHSIGRESRMSFKVNIDKQIKNTMLKAGAAQCAVAMPPNVAVDTTTQSIAGELAHGPFTVDSIRSNGFAWHPTDPTAMDIDSPLLATPADGGRAPTFAVQPQSTPLTLQLTTEGIFIVPQTTDKTHRVYTSFQLSYRRQANSATIVMIALDAITNIRLERGRNTSDDRGVSSTTSDSVLMSVSRSERHSKLIRNAWFPPGVAEVSVAIRTRNAVEIVSSFSTMSIQRLRMLTEGPQLRRKTLTIVHFNDVYNLIEREGPTAAVVGGAARFHTLLNKIRERSHPLVLFSGDFMGPSLMSVDMKGKQMVDFFNQCGVLYGCFGNHEFDYGLKALHEAIQGFTYGAHVFTGSNTQWVMSNMFEASTSMPVAGASQKELFTWNGVRVGIVGLCEDWIGGCSQLAQGEIIYIDMFETGERLARELKADGAEVVIALTHCRLDNDKQLMTRCPSIDLLLGGHDHFFKCVPSLHIVKSGEEFQYLTEITVNVDPLPVATPANSQNAAVSPGMIGSTSSRRTTSGSEAMTASFQSTRNALANPNNNSTSTIPPPPAPIMYSHNHNNNNNGTTSVTPTGSTDMLMLQQDDTKSPLPGVVAPLVVAPPPVPVTAQVSFAVTAYPIHWDIQPSAQMMKLIARYQNKLDERMGGVVGRTAVPLDPRESTVRFREGLLTGFVCDVIVQEMRARLLPNADFAILGGAAFSGKTIIPQGVLTMGHIFDLFPNDTKVMAIRISGATLHKLLTVMVRECPEEAPSFPHCSEDLSFTISLIGGGAPKVNNIQVKGMPLDEDREYVVAVEDFAGKGSGKYKFLKNEAEVLIEEEMAAQVVFWLIDYFSRKKGQTRHTSVALEADALRAEQDRAKKEDRRTRKAQRNRNTQDRLLQSAIDSNAPKFVIPVRQFKPLEFASTLESGALARLYAATTLLSEDVETGSNVALIEKVVTRLLKCMACRVYLFDKVSNILRPLVSQKGVNHAITGQLLADNSSLAGYAVHFNCAVNTKNAPKDPSYTPSVDGSPTLKVQTMLTFPIFYRKQCLGVVQALNKQHPQELDDGGRDMFEQSVSSEDSSTDSESDSESEGEVSGTIRIMVGGASPLTPKEKRRRKKRRTQLCFSDEDQGLALLLSKQIGTQLHFSNMYQRIQLSDEATKNLMEMARLLGRAQKDDSVQTMVLRITDIGKQLIGCDRCSLFLVDKGEMWTVVKTKDLTGNIQIRLPLGTGVAGHAAQTGTKMNIHDAYKSPYFNPETDRRTGYQTRTMLAVPMLSENGESILGVLQLINKNNGKVFTDADEDLAENFVNLAAIAVHNSFEIETLRLGRDESTLQVLPVHELNRITLKQGWKTIRRNLHLVAAMRLVVRGGITFEGIGDSSMMDRGHSIHPLGRSGDDALVAEEMAYKELSPLTSTGGSSGQHRASETPNNVSLRQLTIVRGMQDFDDLQSEAESEDRGERE